MPASLSARQQTVGEDIPVAGVALHSGQGVRVRIRSAAPDSGIRFRRSDLDHALEIPARVGMVGGTERSTSLVAGGERVNTVEHLMAALCGAGIDNAVVELDGPELPILDGSAADWLDLLGQAGVEVQASARHYLRILRPVQLVDGDKEAGLFPFAGFRVSVGIDYDHPLLCGDASFASVDIDHPDFLAVTARARTFGFIDEIDDLHARGLARGAGPANAVVLDGQGVRNPGGLRFADECVQHKVLDAVGDLYLLGFRLLGEFRGVKSGHTLNVQLLRQLLQHEDAWDIVQLPEQASRFSVKSAVAFR